MYEISKKAERAENVGYAAGDDEIIYELAVHYYDEDDIKVHECLNFRTNANGTANESEPSYTVLKSDKKDCEHHETKVQAKTDVKKTQPKAKTKKEKVSEIQISLFDYVG